VNPSLAGPNQLLNSGKVDAIKGTITLPLYEGYMTGTKIPVWYILTDTDCHSAWKIDPLRRGIGVQN